MASFWWDVRAVSKNCYCQIFFISLCVACVKCNVIYNHNNSKKVNKDFILKKYLLPTAHVEEITDMSPVFIMSYKNVDLEISNTIVSLYASTLSVVVLNNNTVYPRCNDQGEQCFKILNFVGIISEPKDVNIKFWIEILDGRWNPRSKIIIWITKYEPSSNIEKLLKLFWLHDCVNVVIIVRKMKSTKFEIYSYNPFIFDKSAKRGLIYQLSYNDTLFSNKIKNLHGYEIRVSMHPRPPYSFLKNFNELDNGTEVEVLRGMISTFNFTPVIITSREDANDYVVRLNNGSDEGPIGNLLINKSDMLGNAFYINAGFGSNVEYIEPFYLADYIVIVPKGIGETLALQFYHHAINFFQDPLYILMSISFSILAFYLHFRKDKYAILTSWELLLYQHFRKFENNYFDKYFRLMWILWATIMTSLYQGVVYKYLSLPKTVADIHSIEELYNNGIQLRIGDDIVTPLNSSEEAYKRNLAQKATVTLKLQDCHEELEKYNNVACGADQLFGLYYFRNLILSENPKAHIVEEPLEKFWVTYMVKDGFPFIENLQFTVRQFIETGLFGKLAQDSMIRYHLIPHIDIHKVVPLSLSYFDITFIFLYLGCTAAAIIFVSEIMVAYFKNKNAKSRLPIINHNAPSLRKKFKIYRAT